MRSRSYIILRIDYAHGRSFFAGLGRGSCRHSDPRCMGGTDRWRLSACHGKNRTQHTPHKSYGGTVGRAALSVSGLQMQTLFRNPLAGPYVLGISSGASLGVALVVLAGIGSSIGIAGAAWVGAAVVLLVITAVGQRIKDIMVILILGMMFSSGVGAVVQILQYLSKEESLKAFVIWTMGALGDVTSGQLLILVPSVFAGLLLAVLTIKPLNLLLFGEEYAVTMGLNIRRSRSLLFLSTTLLAGTITAFCGPIGFIGLAMPHVTRMLFQNSDHHVLLPGTILSGASILLLCDIISKIFTLPINAITALLGIPIVVWVVLRNKSITA